MSKLSVAGEIKALALINILEIFNFVLTAKDDEIEERYITEERAMNIAEKYLEIAQEVDFIESSIKGWSMKYSQPIKDSEERRTHNALFYNKIDNDDKDDDDRLKWNRGTLPPSDPYKMYLVVYCPWDYNRHGHDAINIRFDIANYYTGDGMYEKKPWHLSMTRSVEEKEIIAWADVGDAKDFEMYLFKED